MALGPGDLWAGLGAENILGMGGGKGPPGSGLVGGRV